MPFWLHENKQWLIIKSIPLMHKMVGSGIFLAILVFSWFFLIQRPYSKHLQSKQQEYFQLLQQQELFKSTTDRLDVLHSQNQKLKLQFNQIVHSNQSIQQVIQFLMESMSSAGLACHGIVPKSVKSKKFYQSHMVSIQGRGTFHQLLTFLQTTGRSKHTFKFSSLNVTKSGKELIKFNGLICVYRITEDEENKA